MKLTAQIDSDYKSLNNYFTKLFDVLQDSIAIDKATLPEAEDNDANESLATYHRFSHFIKPDMITNIYSFVDFWIKEICNFQMRNNNLKLDHYHKSFKGKHDLDTYNKYLTQHVKLNLDAVETSYRNLDNLRKVRNLFIHSGGHIKEKDDNKRYEKEKEFSAIPGIRVFSSMIFIEDAFVFSTLDHAKMYLLATTKTSPFPIK